MKSLELLLILINNGFFLQGYRGSCNKAKSLTIRALPSIITPITVSGMKTHFHFAECLEFNVGQGHVSGDDDKSRGDAESFGVQSDHKSRASFLGKLIQIILRSY